MPLNGKQIRNTNPLSNHTIAVLIPLNTAVKTALNAGKNIDNTGSRIANGIAIAIIIQTHRGTPV